MFLFCCNFNTIFVMQCMLMLQVTPKTLADVKGGTLISYEGKVQVCIHSLLAVTSLTFAQLMFCVVG